MIFDFEDPRHPAPERADVCIIGAGAAGIALALALERQGKRVALLEGGGKSLERKSQSLYNSQVTGLPFHGIHDGRLRTLGGTTTEWGGQIMELEDIDFTARPHVANSGWPLQKTDLERYYRQAETLEGVPANIPGEACTARLAQVRRQLPLPANSEVFTALARFCPERDFARLYHTRLRESQALHLHLHANLLEIKLNQDRSAIASVRIGSFGGRSAEVHADNFVLCMGGIETTRMLLQPPAEGKFPWQTNGVLGRYFHDHVACNGILARDLTLHSVAAHFGYIREHGAVFQTKLLVTPAAQEAHGTLNVSGTITRLRSHDAQRDRVTMSLRRFRQGRSGLTSAELLDIVRFLPGIVSNWLSHRVGGWHQAMLQVHCEQPPTTANTVTLSDERDSLGLLRTRLHWTISPQEIHSIRSFVRSMQETFARSRFGNIQPPPGFFEDDAVVVAMCKDSNHHMGSTRMSVSPADGIVDPNLRLHGIRNGYVCSSSVFPTGGSSNPTHTVIALAMRLADHLSGMQA